MKKAILRQMKDNEKVARSIEPSFEPIGASGTKSFQGIISDEYLTDLSSNADRCKYYDRMRRGLGIIRAACKVYELPLMSMSFHVEPASDKPEHKEQAAFGEHILKKSMSRPIQKILEDVVYFLTAGFTPFEKCSKKEDWLYRDEAGNEKIIANMVKPKNLYYRDPATVKRWYFDEEGGIAGFDQYALFNRQNYSGYDTKFLPIKDLVIFTHEQHGDNFEGISILRSGVRHYKAINQLLNYEMIGADRFSIGTPRIKEPVDRIVTPGGRQKAKDVGRRLRVHEEGVIYVPAGWDIDIIGGDGKINVDFLQKAIDRHIACIFLSILAEFLLLGIQGRGGAYALDEEKKDFFIDALRQIALLILDVFERYFLRQYLDWNYTMDEYPSIVLDKLGAKNLTQWASNMVSLFGANMLEINQAVREHTHKKFDLPPPIGEEIPRPRQSSESVTKEAGMLSETFRRLNEKLFYDVGQCSCGTGSGIRDLTEKEKARGMTHEHAIELKERLDENQKNFIDRILPIWEEMKDDIRAQIKKGEDVRSISVPDTLKQKYASVLEEQFYEGKIDGIQDVEKELARSLTSTERNKYKKLARRQAQDVAFSLSQKDAMDILYLIRMEMAQK